MNMHTIFTIKFLIILLTSICSIYAMENNAKECVNSIINGMPRDVHFMILNSVIADQSLDEKIITKTIRSYAHTCKSYYCAVNGEEMTQKLINAFAWRLYYGNKFASAMGLRTNGAGRAMCENNRSNEEITSCFIGACSDGHLGKVSFILAHRLEIINELEAPRGSISGLMRAAARGHLHIVNKLIAQHADVNLKSSVNGDTALIFALFRDRDSRENNWPVIQRLLDAGADIFLTNNYGRNGFFYAKHDCSQFSKSQLIIYFQKKSIKIPSHELADSWCTIQ